MPPVRLPRPQAAADPGDLTPAALDSTIAALRQARQALAARSPESIVTAIGDVVEAWLAPGSDWSARAERVLAETTDFSPEMLSYALPTMLEPLRALAELLAAQVQSRRGPVLILHVLPGNLPGLAAIPAALSLAIGSATLLKAGRGDRVFPSLFAASIAERDADLGACVAACYWAGGARDCEDRALTAADLVVASGSDAAIDDLRARTRGRFIGHGHRISFAVVAREVAADGASVQRAAEQLAEDVALWDQRGCLSPQLCFVEGTLDTAGRFGELVADALRPLANRWPPAQPSAGERLAVRRFREAAEWRALSGEACLLFALPRDGDGTVVVEPSPQFHPTPLCRSLRVMPIADPNALSAILAGQRAVLEAAGLAAPQSRWSQLAEWLAAQGVHRVSGLGNMQRPPLDWRQGGRPRVGDWLVESDR